MKQITLAWGVLMAAVLLPFPLSADDRFWILWEKRSFVGIGCPTGSECRQIRNFTSRMFQPRNLDSIYRLFGQLDGRALADGRLAVELDAPRICQHNASEVQLGFNPETHPISDKLDALKDLKGIGLDIRAIKPPPGYSDTFGAELQSEFEQVLARAGLPVVTPELAQSLPGQPVLNIYFSFQDANGDCDYRYSVFASLSQTALLTRNLTTKLSVGVWSFSTGSGALAGAETELFGHNVGRAKPGGGFCQSKRRI